MNKSNKLRIIMFFAAAFIVSCSSQPKKTGDVFTLRNHAEAGLDLGNKEAGRGNYESAYRTIRESKRTALLTDDSSLIVRCCLSLGNILLEIGSTDEAFAEWEQAIVEAQKSGKSELLAVSKVFYARGQLVSGRASAQSVLDEINKQQPLIKTDRLNIAFSWQAKGLALRSLGSYREAEEAVRQSLEIHEKDLYLENASFDWYTIASIRSVTGNIQGALEALDASITIDRRIENSWGLASSYRAMGDVYRKAGDNEKASEAYEKAIKIYEALGNLSEETETKKRIENVQ
jgi:tetratricopeptide (TPR) repeat protein